MHYYNLGNKPCNWFICFRWSDGIIASISSNSCTNTININYHVYKYIPALLIISSFFFKQHLNIFFFEKATWVKRKPLKIKSSLAESDRLNGYCSTVRVMTLLSVFCVDVLWLKFFRCVCVCMFFHSFEYLSPFDIDVNLYTCKLFIRSCVIAWSYAVYIDGS